MEKKELKKKTGVKKFDICLMNPPYSNKQQYLDVQFVEEVNKICNKQVVIHPAKKWISDTDMAKRNAEGGHLKEIEIIDANKAFDLGTDWKWGGIFVYDNKNTFDTVDIKFNNTSKTLKCDDFNERYIYFKNIETPENIINLIDKKENIYKDLMNKYKTMVNDGHGFIYEENDLARGKKKYGVYKKEKGWGIDRVKKYLKDGTYKYCIYKGSGNHLYDKVQQWNGEDPDKLFRGQVCWLINDDNVKNNLIYWMECPLFDLWRRYKFNLLRRYNRSSGCAYGEIPALDFEMNEDDFKKYVDNLNSFTKEEIQAMIDFNIHNADKLKPKK